MNIMTIEFKTPDVKKLELFLDAEIGTEYESFQERFKKEGYIMVYDLLISEKEKIVKFIKSI